MRCGGELKIRVDIRYNPMEPDCVWFMNEAGQLQTALV